MPTYEYHCLDCESTFDAYASVGLRDAARDCPHCGQRTVKRSLNSSFYASARGEHGSSRRLGKPPGG